MKVIYFTSRFSEPHSTAAGWRSEQIIHASRSIAQVELCSSGGTRESEQFWTDQSFTIHKLEANQPENEKHVQALQADVVVFDRFFMEEQFGWLFEKHSPHTIRVIDTQDLHAVREHRQACFKKHACPSTEFPSLDHPTLQRELASILRSDLSLIISQAELDFLLKLGVPAEKLLYLPLTQPSHDGISFEERSDFVWIGSFRHAPNCDSFRYLQKNIWPQIRERLPQAQLHLYGSYPPAWVMQANNPTQGFLVHGESSHSSYCFSQARVSLAPLPYGAGLKGKVVESLAQGTPVVTNAVGAEGFSFLSKHHHPSDEQFVDSAVQLYSNKATWLDYQTSVISPFRKDFNPDSVIEKWIHFLQDLSQTTPRKKDLWQSLLWNQSHRATEFMSRWIEEKNKR